MLGGSGILELDVHGMTAQEAQDRIDDLLQKASAGTYRIRVIHGYHRGTGIRQMLLEEYRYGRNSRVQKVVNGDNPGITELVLREY